MKHILFLDSMTIEWYLTFTNYYFIFIRAKTLPLFQSKHRKPYSYEISLEFL